MAMPTRTRTHNDHKHTQQANAAGLGISPDHIACSGNSAGGHLSLMVAGVDGGAFAIVDKEKV